MRRQNVIIFSSGKNVRVAHEIAQHLDSEVCCPIVWDVFFKRIYGAEYALNKPYALFPFLIKKIPSFDYAIIVAGDDDTVFKNGQEGEAVVTTRDNVIFELGLCSMALGEKRVVIVRHESVRLIDDLRGYDNSMESYPGDGPCLLSARNVQVKTYDYSGFDDLPAISKQICDYVRQSFLDYSPVVVGSACSTAMGYKDNFLIPIVDRLSLLNDGFRYEVAILLPLGEGVCLAPELMENPRRFIDEYVASLPGVASTTIDCKGRPVHCYFCENAGCRTIIDIPTTLVASRKMAEQVLSIKADDELEDAHLQRLMMKEVDQFVATLKRFLLDDGEGCYFATPEQMERGVCGIRFCYLNEVLNSKRWR